MSLSTWNITMLRSSVMDTWSREGFRIFEKVIILFEYISYLNSSMRLVLAECSHTKDGPPMIASPRPRISRMEPTSTAAWKVSVMMTAFIPPWNKNNVLLCCLIFCEVRLSFVMFRCILSCSVMFCYVILCILIIS